MARSAESVVTIGLVGSASDDLVASVASAISVALVESVGLVGSALDDLVASVASLISVALVGSVGSGESGASGASGASVGAVLRRRAAKRSRLMRGRVAIEMEDIFVSSNLIAPKCLIRYVENIKNGLCSREQVSLNC